MVTHNNFNVLAYVTDKPDEPASYANDWLVEVMLDVADLTSGRNLGILPLIVPFR